MRGVCFENYLSSNTNQYLNDSNYWLGIFDDGLGKLGQHSAGLGQQIAKITGNLEAEQKCKSVSNGFGAFRDAIGAVRFVPAFNKFFTGQMFWQTTPGGWRRVAVDANGNLKRIPQNEILNQTWKKQENGTWRHEESAEVSRDGKYIDIANGKYIMRDWMDVVLDILILVARVISPIRWLHSLKAVDLGKHAKSLGSIVMGVWGMVTALILVQSTRDLINEVDLQKIQQRVWDTFQAIIELIALPFDFGVGSAHPTLAIVGAGLNIVAAGSLLVKEAVYYG